MDVTRCERHGLLLMRGKDECMECVRERMNTPEERAKSEAFFARMADVIRFAEKLKTRMGDLGKTSARVRCPEHPDSYVTAYIVGPRRHMHMSCSVPGCKYWMME